MESLLIVVTVVSLGIAVTMSLVSWTLVRNERQRSAARVEALEALAFENQLEARKPAVRPAVAPAPSPAWDLALREEPADVDVLDDLQPLADRQPVYERAEGLFEPTHMVSPAGRRWLALAAVGLLVVAVVVTASALRSPEIRSAIAASRAGSKPEPLELLSLRHATDADGAFVVTGLVENPAEGRDLVNVEAVVHLFDDLDQYFASARAALDVPTVGPGEESPFVVKVPNATGVSRYRVGFRQADGVAIAHIDRRGQLPEGTTGDTVAEPALAQPAVGIRPPHGALPR